MSDVILAPPTPRLVLLDKITPQGNLVVNLPTEIQFKYVPTDVTQDLSVAWGSSTGMGRSAPILQFSNVEQQKLNFNMKLFAQHGDDNIDAQLALLKQACSKDEKLNRPPRWQFIWGTFIDETVVIQSIGGIRYGDVRPDGSIREVNFSISLLFYQSVDVALIAEDRPTDTFFAVTKSGDQWEDIALREYNEPILGELLRRANPLIPYPGESAGSIVKLPKIQNIRNEPIEPDSIPLRRTAEGLALRAKMYASRSISRESTVLKK